MWTLQSNNLTAENVHAQNFAEGNQTSRLTNMTKSEGLDENDKLRSTSRPCDQTRITSPDLNHHLQREGMLEALVAREACTTAPSRRNATDRQPDRDLRCNTFPSDSTLSKKNCSPVLGTNYLECEWSVSKTGQQPQKGDTISRSFDTSWTTPIPLSIPPETIYTLLKL